MTEEPKSERALDEALDMTFPASDPIAIQSGPPPAQSPIPTSRRGCFTPDRKQKPYSGAC
jgi:hypothetical protein